MPKESHTAEKIADHVAQEAISQAIGAIVEKIAGETAGAVAGGLASLLTVGSLGSADEDRRVADIQQGLPHIPEPPRSKL